MKLLLCCGADASIRQALVTLAPAAELALIETGDTGQFLELLVTASPDILLVDLATKDMDAVALLQAVGNDPRRHLFHVILHLAKGEEGRATELLNLGADDVLRGSVQRGELALRLQVARRQVASRRQQAPDTKGMYESIDVLLIQEGGCAPGYNPATAFLTKFIEEKGRQVYCAREGFRSLVSGRDEDYVRLVYSPQIYREIEHIPGVIQVPELTEAAGARFRSERYREFAEQEKMQAAAHNILARKVQAVVAIGGNGTFYGIRGLCQHIPNSIQVFFVPVTVDSDVYGTETIGQHSGVEFGAEKIRSYTADARTHKRVYIIEMMGARGGFHALHSCLGAHAHLAVLPGFDYDMEKVADGINARESAVIVVAEGYKIEEWKGRTASAAEMFKEELLATGIPINKRVICESFSRDIRGITPNNLDIVLAMRMAWNVAAYVETGASRLMPAILAEEESAIPFNEIDTDNTVNKRLARLANRLY